MPTRPTSILFLSLIGLLAGFFSGLFGVGGGVIIVPLLVMLLNFQQRRASGTSLTAILPTAIAGSIGYAVNGDVDWVVAGCLAFGAIFGSIIGTSLLARIPQLWLRWGFIGFLAVMAVSLFVTVPDRGGNVEYTVVTILGLIGVGLFTGILSGLLGVGGGVVVVPIMILVFGMGDLVAKGSSLLMMIPTSITGTLNNVRNGNSDLRAAAVIGLFAIPASFGGIAVAGLVPPQVASILFGLFLVFTAVQLAMRAIRQARENRS
ncbi:sulfite exporter TauE/SafE family protein [Salinibacterium sp. SYSU T00001]|uniref:sulfite exporter TauE/SafE family protein n=1 Tax=Homoserinimonas sedimenticola TaxID=2986805 RepID=UPI0022355F5E|nr:sulfite exporter TauE/SafE family protein [Salinibacterium sedimenticola]MCW4386377.1 sulfite exporter TauE/SafE family protein [Salinibacterium sedimenticola]